MLRVFSEKNDCFIAYIATDTDIFYQCKCKFANLNLLHIHAKYTYAHIPAASASLFFFSATEKKEHHFSIKLCCFRNGFGQKHKIKNNSTKLEVYYFRFFFFLRWSAFFHKTDYSVEPRHITHSNQCDGELLQTF